MLAYGGENFKLRPVDIGEDECGRHQLETDGSRVHPPERGLALLRRRRFPTMPVAASLDACLKRKPPMLNLDGFETSMTDIPVKYIVDENDQKVAVQMDIETFKKIEEALENYGLSELIKQSLDEESLSLKEAKSFYDSLEKPE